MPYRLPELLAANADDWVLLCEGEKDCDQLRNLGFGATTTAAGAKGWRDDYAEYFHNKRVAILPDNDLPGGRYAAQAAETLRRIAREVRVVHLPDLPKKGDCSDWLDAGGNRNSLLALIENTIAWDPNSIRQNRLEDQLPGQSRQPVGVLASEVTPEPVTWLWSGRLAKGKITMVDGDPGLGKSTLALDIAASVTTGQALPGGKPTEPRGVVILNAEDGAADTIVPRLKAAGADLRRVYILTGVKTVEGEEDEVTVPAELDAIEEAIRRINAALVIVDPIVAYLGHDVNSNRDQDVRSAMRPFAEMLERSECAGLFLRHLNKSGGSQAIYRGGGSIGIIGAARFGLLLGRDPEDDDARVLAAVKVNIGPFPNALRFRLDGTPGSDVAHVVWDSEPISVTAAALLSASSDEGQNSALSEAKLWLDDLVKQGPTLRAEIYRQAKKDGFSDITIRRAKMALGIETSKSGFGKDGKWIWAYPDENMERGAANMITETLRRSARQDERLRQSVITLAESETTANLLDPYDGGESGVL